MALLATIYLILHFGAGLVFPYRPGFKPYFYQYVEEAGIDFEKRLNRANRPQSVRIIRGAAAGLLMAALACIAGFIVWYAGKHMHVGFAFIQLLFLSCCINFHDAAEGRAAGPEASGRE